jgi:hypothetical protein
MSKSKQLSKKKARIYSQTNFENQEGEGASFQQESKKRLLNESRGRLSLQEGNNGIE